MNAKEASRRKVPLIAHVIFRLNVGGLENGVINLINRIPDDRYRHAIICITDATSFKDRLERQDIAIVELKKKAGNSPSVYWRMWLALRNLRPDIVHTRNANAIEFQFVAALAGVHGRIHGEHGWDVHDMDGTSVKYRMLRKILAPVVQQFFAVSQDLERYLLDKVRVPGSKVVRICNGVDFADFRQRSKEACRVPWHNSIDETIVIGTVGRMQVVKNQMLLVRSFLRILELRPDLRDRLRLLMVGDGPLYAEIKASLEECGVGDVTWLPGVREDVPALMARMDVFVLPSSNEGISNTILEAMALGIPVVATRVGGNEEIVVDDETGKLVAVDDVDGMAAAIIRYIDDPGLRRAHGDLASATVEKEYAIDLMVNRYLEVYDAFAPRSLGSAR